MKRLGKLVMFVLGVGAAFYYAALFGMALVVFA